MALRTMDDALLPPDAVDALLAALPTPDEVALVRADDAPGVVWDRSPSAPPPPPPRRGPGPPGAH